MRVYKFPLDADKVSRAGEFSMQMPVGSTIISFQMQFGVPTLWAVCDPEEKTLGRYDFILTTTGADLHGEVTFIGTIQDSIHVWHLFLVERRKQ